MNGVKGKQGPSTICGKKNSLEGLNSQPKLVETESATGRIEGRLIETVHSKEEKKNLG